jgi:serine/threonine protein kinase
VRALFLFLALTLGAHGLELTVESEPPGAQVFDASQNYLGTTPCVIARDPRLSQILYLQCNGYTTARVRVEGTQSSAHVVLEPNAPATWLQRNPVLLGGGLVALGLGAWGIRRWSRSGMPIPISGRRVGGYRVLEKIGEGSSAAVYRLEGPYAMKLFHTVVRDPRDRERLRRELEVGLKLKHPNLVRVHDFGELEGRPYLVVDFVEGEPLSDRLMRGPLEPALALSVLKDVASALDAIHAEGVVHRDVTPANIMLDVHDRAYLTDFGLAVWTERPRITATGTALGTPLYMAPEMLLERTTHPRADLYSLAVVLYEMLTGCHLFAGDDAYQVLAAHLHQAPPALSEKAPHLPEAMQAIFDKGLAKEPVNRFETAREMVVMMEAAL